MSQAYTPGLTITPFAVLRKTRKLPLKGEVLVEVGQIVEPQTLVARAYLPGIVHIVKAGEILGVAGEDLEKHILKREGEKVEKDEVIATATSFFGLSKRTVRSPIRGTIESISPITGNISIREEPKPIYISAYIKGKVVEILPAEGVVVEARGAFLQGIFGVGGERWGHLKVVVDSPEEPIKDINGDMKDCIIVGGSIDGENLRKAIDIGVKGVVVGGIYDEVLRDFLGYDIGVAITGQEDIPLTLIIMEGFGTLPLARRTFELLRRFNGFFASINGATQIRAGVIRPEIIIPHNEPIQVQSESFTNQLVVGAKVRVIREPYFGRLGEVLSLPPEPQILETGAKVRVAEVRLEEGVKVVIPRANLEIIID
ncbi:hypothetical protein H5T87_06375 [bacterium]|nr:hypothetical protein [bacterium]